MTDDITQDPAPGTGRSVGQPPVRHQGDLGKWWWQGARSAALQRVDWDGLRTSPGILACLLLAPTLLAMGAARLYVIGPAEFFSPALLFGWLGTVVAAWASWLLVPEHRTPALAGPHSAVHLLAMLLAQAFFVMLVAGVVGLLAGCDQGRPRWRDKHACHHLFALCRGRCVPARKRAGRRRHGGTLRSH